MSEAGLFSTDQFIAPAYGAGCFSDIPAFLRHTLTGAEPTAWRPPGWERQPQHHERVVAIFIDAFGWRFFERFQDHPLLQRFIHRGVVNRITSQFPSTTSAHVTTLYTGQPVGQHGVFEWFYYEPTVDRLIAPLLFSYAGDDERETLARDGVDGTRLLPNGALAADLAASGVKTVVFQPKEFVHSTYSTRMTGGARSVGYQTLAEGLTNITLAFMRQNSPLCCVLYYGAFDSVCHQYGPDTPQSDAELDAVLTLLERWLVRDMERRFPETLLMLFADHGQEAVKPETTLYLNRLPIFEQLRPLLRVNRRGQILAPGGSPRDFFLYGRDECVEEAQSLLAGALAGRADVVRADDLAHQGFFGPPPISNALADRMSSLVVLPYAGESVYWYERDRFVQKYHGHHGGLLRSEMEIPLLLTQLG
jgi:hypothetical protein